MFPTETTFFRCALISSQTMWIFIVTNLSVVCYTSKRRFVPDTLQLRRADANK
jgi:hypothetical protein